MAARPNLQRIGPGEHRYGVVLALTVLVVLFAVLAPQGELPKAISLELQLFVLLAVLVTSGRQPLLRQLTVGRIAAGTTAVAVLAAFELIPSAIVTGLSALIVVGTFPQMLHGLADLLRTRGVTVQAIAGGLAIYLLLGMLFSFVIGFAATVLQGVYFASGTDGTSSEHVYFSFTTMTTTGYGDFVPVTRAGRTIAVFEMLVGQIYLVTVIALLMGNLRARRAAPPEDDAAQRRDE